GEAQRADERDDTAHGPYGDDQPSAFEIVGDEARQAENASADNKSCDHRNGAEQRQALSRLTCTHPSRPAALQITGQITGPNLPMQWSYRRRSPPRLNPSPLGMFPFSDRTVQRRAALVPAEQGRATSRPALFPSRLPGRARS